jgi:hypothetical protein
MSYDMVPRCKNCGLPKPTCNANPCQEPAIVSLEVIKGFLDPEPGYTYLSDLICNIHGELKGECCDDQF